MKSILFLSIFGFLWVSMAFGQYEKKGFTLINSVKTSDVKSQGQAGTCWSFSATSFIETEALRKGNGSFDISDLYFVWFTYKDKAYNYYRRHGKANFSQGGQAHDVINVIKRYGMVTEKTYDGLPNGQEIFNHALLENLLLTTLDAVLKNKKEQSTQIWQQVIEFLLDEYIGVIPEKVVHKKKEYSPQEFASKVVGFEANDYVEITSYNHHPFYEKFNLEVPDNWSGDYYYNVPLNDLMKIFDYALANNYSFVWDGDVSSAGFQHRKGTATNSTKTAVTQESRQKDFDDFTSTDDHLMHIVGSAKDDDGIKYYITKNSWGAESNSCGGFLYMSEDYVKLNTVAILLHKDAVPKKIAKKLGL